MSGQLASNIVYFARLLRAAGLPVGPGSVLDAVRAVEVAGLGGRGDFQATLHAIFVKTHEHTIIFNQAFELFWRKRGMMEKMMEALAPRVSAPDQTPPKPKAGASRVSDAFYNKKQEQQKQAPALELDSSLTASDRELLQRKDFAQMTAQEMAHAMAAIARLKLAHDDVLTRRLAPDRRGRRLDPRAIFRKSLRAGGAGIELAFMSKTKRPPPIVAICDISGSMSDYTRVFLHFLHALNADGRRVHAFLFGTRLTNVTRALRSRDIDEALALCSAQVEDWSGGTRISASLRDFNRLWSRRVLGQGASVILFTDGLERDGVEDLSREMERLHKSCKRLIWLNPLLRYDRFEPKAGGIRAMLPHVDDFRSAHNVASIAELVSALSSDGQTQRRG